MELQGLKSKHGLPESLQQGDYFQIKKSRVERGDEFLMFSTNHEHKEQLQTHKH